MTQPSTGFLNELKNALAPRLKNMQNRIIDFMGGVPKDQLGSLSDMLKNVEDKHRSLSTLLDQIEASRGSLTNLASNLDSKYTDLISSSKANFDNMLTKARSDMSASADKIFADKLRQADMNQIRNSLRGGISKKIEDAIANMSTEDLPNLENIVNSLDKYTRTHTNQFDRFGDKATFSDWIKGRRGVTLKELLNQDL